MLGFGLENAHSGCNLDELAYDLANSAASIVEEQHYQRQLVCIALLAIMAPVNPSGCSRGGASRRIHLLIASATAAFKPGAHAAQVLERAHLSRIDCGGATPQVQCHILGHLVAESSHPN